MSIRWLTVFGLAAFTSVASVACTASSDGSDAPGDEATGEDDLTSRHLSGAVAVEIARAHVGNENPLEAKTVGTPKKVKTVLDSVRKLRPNEPQPRCFMQEGTRLTFLDAGGKKLGSVTTHCAGFGSIDFANGAQGFAVKIDEDKVQSVKDAKLAVGDALWGITKIEIRQFGENRSAMVNTAEGVKAIVAAYDLEAVPDPTASMPRCPATHTLSFTRGDLSTAHSGFICGALTAGSAPSSVKATFTAVDGMEDSEPLAFGAITIDPRPALKALDAAATR